LRQTGLGKHPKIVRGWMMLLLQAQLALIYFSSFLFKLYDPVWVGGTALAHAWQFPFFGRPWTETLTGLPWLVAAGTWGTLLFEVSFPLLIWFRRLGPWLLVCGALFHLCIEVTLRLGIFSYAMMAVYVPFLSAGGLRNYLTGLIGKKAELS
jgi:hypothetical protein